MGRGGCARRVHELADSVGRARSWLGQLDGGRVSTQFTVTKLKRHKVKQSPVAPRHNLQCARRPRMEVSDQQQWFYVWRGLELWRVHCEAFQRSYNTCVVTEKEWRIHIGGGAVLGRRRCSAVGAWRSDGLGARRHGGVPGEVRRRARGRGAPVGGGGSGLCAATA